MIIIITMNHTIDSFLVLLNYNSTFAQTRNATETVLQAECRPTIETFTFRCHSPTCQEDQGCEVCSFHINHSLIIQPLLFKLIIIVYLFQCFVFVGRRVWVGDPYIKIASINGKLNNGFII